MAAPAHRASVCAAPEAVHSPWSVPFPPSAKPEMSHLSDPLFVVTHLYPRPGKSLQSKGITPLPGAHLDEPGEAPRLKVLTSTLVAKTLCHVSMMLRGSRDQGCCISAWGGALVCLSWKSISSSVTMRCIRRHFFFFSAESGGGVFGEHLRRVQNNRGSRRHGLEEGGPGEAQWGLPGAFSMRCGACSSSARHSSMTLGLSPVPSTPQFSSLQ